MRRTFVETNAVERPLTAAGWCGHQRCRYEHPVLHGRDSAKVALENFCAEFPTT
jgi:hypothetical protein